MGHREADQARLWPRASSDSTLITNLTTRPGAGTGERRDGSGVVVGFYLHQEMNGLLMISILTRCGIGKKSTCRMTLDNSRIVGISG